MCCEFLWSTLSAKEDVLILRCISQLAKRQRPHAACWETILECLGSVKCGEPLS